MGDICVKVARGWAAWSNESFELWYLLHFVYLEAGISRADYIKILENEIRKFDGYREFSYLKNDRKFMDCCNR